MVGLMDINKIDRIKELVEDIEDKRYEIGCFDSIDVEYMSVSNSAKEGVTIKVPKPLKNTFKEMILDFKKEELNKLIDEYKEL